MPKSNSRTYRNHRITHLACRDLYVVSDANGMHQGTGVTASHARPLVDALEAAKKSHPKQQHARS